MERQFGLPVVIVATLHGVLLFGVGRGTSIPLVPEQLIPVSRHLIPLVMPAEVPEEVVETSSESSRENPKPVVDAPIRSPERILPVMERDFPIQLPRPARGKSDSHQILADSMGVPGGIGNGVGPGSILSAHALDNPPRARFQGSPLFPHEARREGLRGEVTVEFVVDETGRVVAPRVVRSSHRIFEEATLKAVAKWQFYPGRSHGRAVRFRMAVPVLFSVAE